MKLLRAEYNRRAQLRPLFWDSTIQLPLEKVFTRLKIVSRQKPGDQTKPKLPYDEFFSEILGLKEAMARVRAPTVDLCDIFGLLKKGEDFMTITEGSPGIGKTTFCLKLAYDWANESGSAESFPEFELVLLLKCRDIDEDLTEAITNQLFPKDMSKDAREELLRFLEDIENQERVLIILDGLDELAEKSKHYVDDLLHRKRWACCYVLATTRQEKGIEVRKKFVFNLFLHIEGFTREDSFDYIRRHFKIAGPEHSSKGEKLIEEIKKNALLQDLQTNPLNLLLLCVVYEDHEGELPSSRTDLYHVIVVCLLRRYCAKHDVKAGKKDGDLEKQFERDIRCLGKLAWNCVLNDRHSFFEEELEEFECRNEKLVARELGFVYKEESLKRLKPQHEYCFLHKSFQEYLAASYIAHKLRRNKFNTFQHLSFNAVVEKCPQVFVFVCGILREEASILFAQIGEKLKSDWDWLECSEAAAKFFIESWSESGNAEGMAKTLCSFMPFPRVAHLYCQDDSDDEGCNLVRVLLFCRRFSKEETPDEIHLEASFCSPLFIHSTMMKDLSSLPNLKSLDFSDCDMDVEFARELFQSLPYFASLTELALPDVRKLIDWGIVAEALTTSKTLKTVGCFLLGERGEGWIRALGAGLCADTPLSSVNLRICGPMSETVLQALENLLLNKSLSSLSIIVEGDMPDSLTVTLARCLTGQTAVKSLELRVNGKLSFCGANLIQRGIVQNNSLSNLVFSLHGEFPDNWQEIVENLNERLAEKSTVSFEIYPNNFSQITASQVTRFRLYVIEDKELAHQSITLNVWGELTVDGAEALYNILPRSGLCHLTLNIHGKLTVDFLHCTAKHVHRQKSLCPITINTWDQLTNDEKGLFKELELDKNPAVILNVCDVHVPSDELGDNKIVSVDNAESLIALLEEAGSTRKENLAVTINVQNDDSSCDDSDESLGLRWNNSLLPFLGQNFSLMSLTLTINNFSKESAVLLLGLFDYLGHCGSLKSLTLKFNEYNKCDSSRRFLMPGSFFGPNQYSNRVKLRDRVKKCTSFLGTTLFPTSSLSSFTLIISDFNNGIRDTLLVDILVVSFKYLTSLSLTLNNCGDLLPEFLDAVMQMNLLKILKLKINDSHFTSGCHGYDFSKLVVKNLSLELIELTISCYGVKGSSQETLKWEKQ